MAITVAMVEELATHSLQVLENQLFGPLLIHRDPIQNEIGVKGKTVNVIAPPTFQANDFSGTLTKQDTVETLIPVTLDTHKHVAYDLPDFENTVQNRDLIREWAASAMAPLAQAVDVDTLNCVSQGVTSNLDIIGASNASLDYAKLGLGRKRALKKMMVNAGGPLNYIVSPDDDSSLLDDDKIINRNYNGGGGESMKDAFIGKARGFNIFTSANTPAPTPGDTSGAVNNGAGYAIGIAEIAMDAVTSAPPVGTIFTFAGHTTKYRVLKNSTTTALKFAPALTASVADNEVITFLDVNQNLGFHKDCAVLAMRPMELPQVGGQLATVVEHNGISLRVMVSYSHNALSHVVSYDILYGLKFIDPRLAFLHMSQKVA